VGKCQVVGRTVAALTLGLTCAMATVPALASVGPAGAAEAAVVPTGTASYSGTTSQGYAVTLSVTSHEVTFKTFNTARCSNGGTTQGPSSLGPFVVSEGGTFSANSSRQNVDVSGSTERYNLSDTLSGRVQGGLASGQFEARTAFYAANGSLISRCDSGLLHWTAHLATTGTGGVAVPKPTGKVVQVGEGVSVRLEKGWAVTFRAPAQNGDAAEVELERTSAPHVLFYVFDDYPTSYDISQLLQVDFNHFAASLGWLSNVRTGSMTTFSIGPGGVFDQGAGESFTGTGKKSNGSTFPLKGVTYAFLESSSYLGATVYALAEPSNYTSAVQGQVEGMVDSIVSPGNE